ncbi:helix-turn-helix transcriptional regulator [Bacteroides sp.]|uniref:helix-turn-helix domain-containing protein n=1 Tax=Bacteroides sp. TaxID=29523 RepID=UPI0025857551|nr:helix-turn-helix transcriptional regulator [Bacteroides sp.]
MKQFDLQRFLNDYSYTQKELAGLLSCSQPYLSAILSGKKFFSKEKLDLLKSYIDSDITSYITDNNLNEIPDKKKPLPQSAKVITVQAEAWDVIKKQADALKAQAESNASKDNQIEELISLLKKGNVHQEDNAGCADASGSDLVR